MSTVRLSVNGLDVVTPIDTGANYSVMSRSFASKLKKIYDKLERSAHKHSRRSPHPTKRKLYVTYHYKWHYKWPAAFVIVLLNCPRDVILSMGFLIQEGSDMM